MDFKAISLFRWQTHSRFSRNTRHRHLQHLKKTGTDSSFEPDKSSLSLDLTPPLHFFVGGARFHFFRLRVDSAQTSCETYLDISQTLRLLVRKTPLLGILDSDQGRVNSPLR